MSTESDALLKINEFEKWDGNSDWINVKQADLVTGMKDRIKFPNHINTSTVNLCGPAAFFRCLAMDDPVMYVKAVIDLYRTNSALIGTRKFKSSQSLRITTPPAKAPAVDWILLGSLRDDENTLLNYTEGVGVDGITLPSAVEKWFKQAGYTNVKNVTNVFFTKDLANIKKAGELLAADNRVCLFINADMLSATKQTHKSVIPDHWVCLTDAVKLDGDNISTQLWCWGKARTVPAQGTLSTSSFLGNYYGYVAAGIPKSP